MLLNWSSLVLVSALAAFMSDVVLVATTGMRMTRQTLHCYVDDTHLYLSTKPTTVLPHAVHVHALVTLILVGLPHKSLYKLQLVQNSAARVISRTSSWEHITCAQMSSQDDIWWIDWEMRHLRLEIPYTVFIVQPDVVWLTVMSASVDILELVCERVIIEMWSL